MVFDILSIWYSWIIENRGAIKFFYGLVIILICTTIVFKTNKLFRLSLHQGIRYFRNAFFFFGIAFIIRYFIAAYGFFYPTSIIFYYLTKIFFEFFIIMGGFFLLYSLLWKKIEGPKKHYPSSLFNPMITLFYLMALVLVVLDYIWQAYYFLFISQIVIFVYASIVSYVNFKNDRARHKFPKLYFIAMLLSLAVWTLNALAALWLGWNLGIMIDTYIINTIIFLLFLYGVVNVTKKLD